MTQADAEQAQRTALTLVEVLTAYQEELLALEGDIPGLEALRRAVGLGIAEACCLISDRTASPEPGWVPPARGWAD